MTDRLPVLFCDGILDAKVVNGVVRITLGQVGGDGTARPCGQIVLPLTQLPATAGAMVSFGRQIQDRLKTTTTEHAAAEPPSALRYS